MTVKIYRGDAPKQAQSVLINPPEHGGLVDIVIGGRPLGFDSEYVASQLVSKLSETVIEEFKEIVARTIGDDNDSPVLLTAKTPGKPFAIVLTLNGQTGITDEVQKILISNAPTGGTFTLTYDGQTSGIAWNADQYEITSALEALSNIGVGDVVVAGTVASFTVRFTGALAGVNQPGMSVDVSSLTGGNNLISIATITAGVTGVNAVQSVVLGGATGGTFTLSYGGTPTAIAYNANAAAVESALEAVVGSGNVSCTGGALPSSAILVEFVGGLAGSLVSELVGDGSSLTGGSGPTVTSITTGVAGTNEVYTLALTSAPTSGDQVGILISDSFDIEYLALFDYDATATEIQAVFDAALMGAGHFTVAGSIDGSWLDPGDPSYSVLTVTLEGRLQSWEGTFYPADGILTAYLFTSSATAASQGSPYRYSSTNYATRTTTGVAGTNAVVEIAAATEAFRIRVNGGTWSEIIETTDQVNAVAFALFTAFDSPYPDTVERVYLGPYNTLRAYGMGCTVTTTGVSGDSIGTSAMRLTFDAGGFQSQAITVETQTTAGEVFVETTVAAVESIAEKLLLTITGESPWGGSFTLSDDSGNTTDPINWNGTYNDVETELAAIFGSANVVCSGGPLPGSGVYILFDRSLGNVEPITGDGDGLNSAIGEVIESLKGGQEYYPTTLGRSLGPEHFDDANNWSEGRVPTRADELYFESGATGPKYGIKQLATFTVPAVRLDDRDIYADDHSFVDGQTVRLTTTGTLPTGLSTGTDYEIDLVNQDRGTFSLRTPGGGLVDVTADGSGVHTVALEVARILQYATFRGSIGLPRYDTAGKYKQYRETRLCIGFTSSAIVETFGQGDGAGSGLIRLYHGDYQFYLESITTGGSLEQDRPALLIEGANDGNTLEIFDGDVGVAVFSDQSATLDTLIQRGGTCVLGEGVTFASGGLIDKTGGDLIIMDAATAAATIRIRG